MAIYVAYWSGTGNTQTGADMVAKGIVAGGKEAETVSVENFSADQLKDCPVFVLGCPSMGDEVLEETVMEPFVAEVEAFAAGKKIGLFGSYGWGDGQWMRDWTERVKNDGATLVNEEGLIVNETPDDKALKQCRELGQALSQ